MRIALFAPVFLRPTETFIYDAACALADAGLDVHVVAGARQLTRECPFRVVRVAPAPGRLQAGRLLRRLLRPVTGASGDDETFAVQAGRVGRHLRSIRPQVVLAHYGQGGALCEPACRDLSIPLLVCFHGADATRAARRPAWMTRYRRLFETATLVTAPSKYIVNHLQSLGCPPEKLRVQRNGNRMDAVRARPEPERPEDRKVHFLFVGRLTHKKGPLRLLEAYASARSTLAPALDARLTIIGDGPLCGEVEKTITRLELDDGVALLGAQPHRAVLAQYGSADVYVQHSVTTPTGDQEGLPVSITEAMAAGLPVIATRHSGIPEAVIHGETGLLADEHDVAGMAARMVELAREPGRRRAMGDAGRARFEAEFAMPVVQARLRALLSEAIAEREPGHIAAGGGIAG